MKYFYIVIFLFFANILLGQWNWGFRIGNSFSTFENNVITSVTFGTKNKVKQVNGIDILGFIKYELNSNFSVQTELHFLTKGGEILHEVIPMNRENTESTFFRYQFLEFPVILNYNFKKKDFLLFFIGGSFGYGISMRNYGNHFCLDDTDLFLCFRTENIKRGNFFFTDAKKDISGLVGFSLSENFLNQKFVFDIRYLHDFNNGFYNRIIDKPIIRHRNWLITIGMEF